MARGDKDRIWQRLLRFLPGFSRRHDDPRHTTGRNGERLAAHYLKRSGLRVIARNHRTPACEIDLLCLDREAGIYVIVEVKSSMTDRAGAVGARRVGPEQRKRLLRASQYLRRKRGVEGVRIDIVTVDRAPGEDEPKITHHKGAVTHGSYF